MSENNLPDFMTQVWYQRALSAHKDLVDAEQAPALFKPDERKRRREYFVKCQKQMEFWRGQP